MVIPPGTSHFAVAAAQGTGYLLSTYLNYPARRAGGKFRVLPPFPHRVSDPTTPHTLVRRSVVVSGCYVVSLQQKDGGETWVFFSSPLFAASRQ